MEWKTIDCYDDYQVSDTGVVRKTTPSYRVSPTGILKQSLVYGYPVVTLMSGKKATQFKVHRLVAAAFLPPPLLGQDQVAHCDGSRDNNHWTNLRWATCKENLSDRVKHKTTLDGARNGRVKLTADQVQLIRKRYKKRHPIDGAAAMAVEFGVSDVAIIKAASGQNWASIPLLA